MWITTLFLPAEHPAQLSTFSQVIFTTPTSLGRLFNHQTAHQLGEMDRNVISVCVQMCKKHKDVRSHSVVIMFQSLSGHNRPSQNVYERNPRHSKTGRGQCKSSPRSQPLGIKKQSAKSEAKKLLSTGKQILRRFMSLLEQMFGQLLFLFCFARGLGGVYQINIYFNIVMDSTMASLLRGWGNVLLFNTTL